MIETRSSSLVHSKPRVVALSAVEDELISMRNEGEAADAAPSAVLRACTITLVVLCDRDKDPEALEELVTQVVQSHPARVILIAHPDLEREPSLETRISTYQLGSKSLARLVGEEIAFYPCGSFYDALPSAILALRVSALPFVLYWRGQPDLEDRLFRALVGECDQILFDSQHFTARAERINNTIVRLRLEYPHVSFGDVNWQRIRPWREFVAQFFDDPANLPYLDTITRVEIYFSVGLGGNQSAAVLLMAWLASSLGWQVKHGSYRRHGHTRTAQFLRRIPGSRELAEIEVLIHVRDQPDCMPGELTGVRLESSGDPPGIFEVKRAVGGFVDIKDNSGPHMMERCAALVIPEESTVLTSELDAARFDRNYHRALELLDALVLQNP
jgi:glucose-6-phosphate dehydrogenase assembly protein OpcA